MTTTAYNPEHAWSDFVGAMASAGIRTKDKIGPSAKIIRFHVEGDRNGTKNGWMTFHADMPSSGAFGSYKLGVNETWTIDKPERLTPQDRAELQRRMAETRREREEELAANHAQCREVAALIMAATEPARQDHAYLVKKNLNVTPGLKQLARDVKYTVNDPEKPNRTARKGALVIPIYGPDKTLHSVQTIDAAGRKHFLFGTNKKGHYWSLGKLTPRIIVGEGYSTCSTVQSATGCCTVIAFDSGNLKAVALAIRAKYPEAEIVIAADNDRFTTKPVPNPGMTKACEAAAEVGGLVAWPEFDDGEMLPDGEIPTDFNDLAAIRQNRESVAAAFAVACAPHDIENHVDPRRQAAERPKPAPEPERQPERQPAPEQRPGPPPLEDDERRASKSIVKDMCVGFEPGPVYYFKSRLNGLITSATRGEVGKATFLTLADLSFWEDAFPSKQGADWTAAANAMINEASKYDFEPDNIIGRGVHLDDGRVVLHLGKKLIVDGIACALEIEDSNRIYERRKPIRLKPAKPLDAALGLKLVECLDLLPWTTSDMARIFAGWLVIAPLCGMLSWRPHLWIIGPRGSGKTWVMKEVATRILGKLAMRFQGATTEAGIRHELARDALPVIFDEAESQNEKSRERLQLIIDMARQSSSEGGGDVVKGGQNGKTSRFKLQSTFLFGSINLGADQAADLSRIITLSLEGPQPNLTHDEKLERAQSFDHMKRQFSALLHDDFGARLFARSLRLAKTIRANAEMIAAVMAENADSQRVSDTVAPPMAGWFSLHSDELLTREAARKLLTEHSWALDVAARAATDADHDSAVSHLLDQKVRVHPAREETIAGLIWSASAEDTNKRDVSADLDAVKALLNIGIKVVPGVTTPGFGDVIFAAGNSELSRYFDKTPWARSWSSVFAQHPRCTRLAKTTRFGARTAKGLKFSVPDLGIEA